VKKLLARDPVYAKLFELGKATTKSWNDNAKARADVLALVLAMDDARVTQSRKASAGCSEKTWAAFAAAISSVPAKRFENMRGNRDKRLSFLDDALGVALDSPDVYLAGSQGRPTNAARRIRRPAEVAGPTSRQLLGITDEKLPAGSRVVTR
jgi:hypothetical protein